MSNPLMDQNELVTTIENPSKSTPMTTPKKRSIVSRFASLVMLCCAVAGGFYLGKRTVTDQRESIPQDTQSQALSETAKVMVTAEPVTIRSVQRVVEAVGTLYGFEEVQIAAKVEGRIRKVHHDVSDKMKPGELIVEIDPTDYQLAVEKAEGDLLVELAKLGLTELPTSTFDISKVPSVVQSQVRMENFKLRSERMNRLAANRTTSAEEQETAASEFRAAQAELAHQVLMAKSGLATVRMKQAALAIAKQQLKDTQIVVPTPTQPVPGAGSLPTYTMIQRGVSEGSLVRPGMDVCRLVILQTLKLRVFIPERHSSEIKLGQNVEVSSASYSHTFTGVVTRLNPSVDQTTRTFEVEIQVPNSNSELKPGGFAKAAIQTRLDPAATTVPLTSIVSFAGINKVFLVTGNFVKDVPVKLGVQTSEWVEVLQPKLAKDAQVVTSGQSMLAADTPIAIRPNTAPSPNNRMADSQTSDKSKTKAR